MEFIRNTLGVIVGLAMSFVIITVGVRLNPSWVNYDSFSPFEHWGSVLFAAKDHHENYFFVALLISSGVAATIGGVVTAVIVPRAKVAYAILIGFILLFLAMIDVVVFPYHPTFYKITIFLVFFPFSWVGGKIVEVIFEKKKIKK
ncbi:hypothetical protein [Riemerella columbipharyngis]|uniref:Uncharacterized protein n=1 Tax=Riemerella columbipharyngis TaxID=1071918 RepID=A0A1G7D4U6_9FLAO|nr:hypothetical protein [Riemerella columbipharyngis]SDE46513.1 hypothetical protein SAMN05421544_1109 [Riemerella columbipharyngis]